MKLMMAFLVIGLITTFQPAVAEEEQEKDKTYKMNEVVVTATRTETMVEDVPVSVSIVNKEDIEKMHVKTLDDALNKLAGVRVYRYGGMASSGSHPQIGIRGTGSIKRVLVLKDGIPLSTSYTGGVYNLNTMSTDDIERIEVIRGAGSALYGSSAMGGMINIITRPPEKEAEGSLSYEYGEEDTHIYNFNASRGFEKIGFRISAGGRNSNGYKGYKKWKSYYKKGEIDTYNISPEIYLKLGESKLRLQYEFFDEETLAASSKEYDSNIETDKYTVDYTINMAKTDFNAKFYYIDMDAKSDSHKYNSTTEKYDEFYYHQDKPMDDWGLMLQASREIKGLLLTIGSDLRWGKCESDYDYDKGPRYFEGNQKLYSGFLHAEYPLFNDRLIFSTGIRYDWWKNYGGEVYDATGSHKLNVDYPDNTENNWSPSAGLVYHLTEDTRFRASFGTGFRTPGLYDLYGAYTYKDEISIGNPDLDPEKMTYSVDAGFDTKLFKNLDFSITVYHSSYKDFIDYRTLAPEEVPSYISVGLDQEVRQKVNIGKVHIYGTETSLGYSFNSQWKAFANYTWNRTTIEEHDLSPELEDNYFRSVPRWMVNFGITYDNPRLFTLSIYVRSVSSIYYNEDNTKKMGGYMVGDLKISRQLFKNMDVFLNIDNFTDKKYSESYNYYSPGFWVMSGLKYTF
jgi:iron complex outermembrane receptor protein